MTTVTKRKLTAGITLAALMGITGCSQQSATEATSTADTTATSSQEVTTLRLSHFWPSTAAMHTEVVEPWAQKIAEESDGRLLVEIYPSASLSKPDVTYDSVAKGTVDIGIQVPGYINGRFPLTQVAELPGLSNTAGQMSCMLQKLYDDGDISSEYEDTKLLFMIGAGPSVIHSIDTAIRTPADMKGLRIRRPSDIAGNIIEIAGASPVGLPASDLYTSLQRGVIDGMSLPWSPAGSFKLTEIVNNHTNMPIYSSALLMAMNKDKYNSLPDDLKKVIDDNSGVSMAMAAGEMFDKEDSKFRAESKAKGDVMIDIPDPLNDPNWGPVLKEATQKYLNDVEAAGLDAQAAYQKAQAASTACET
ncbi:TRAP transporter substrate-binding protein [uncultured Psychrobacter sp.]|uniref:TRAP transporter substrate-binding protein n=1 Tax=uncultured Psychrobacter sp. TaxID=259303 RepID=UPI00345A7BF9